MLKTLIIAENLVLDVTRDNALWRGTITDISPDRVVQDEQGQMTVAWTDKQLGAVLALASGYDDTENDDDPTVYNALYEIAEPLFSDATKNLRFIP